MRGWYRSRSLVHLEQPADAIEILDATQVLPSENARASHRLYEQAHTLAALDAIDDGALEQARRHLGAALDWPERLGQGRPYEPEQRLVQYMLGSVELQLGKRPQARVAFEAVVDATGQTGASADRLDLLAIPSLVALGRTAEISAMWSDTESDVGRFGEELIRAMEGGEDPSEASMRLAAEHSGLFEDLLGRMLLRALEAG